MALRRESSPLTAQKRQLAKAIGDAIDRKQLTQVEAARLARDAQSQLSLLIGGHLRGFSLDRLVRILTRLGYNADIVMRRSRRSTGKIRVVVRR